MNMINETKATIDREFLIRWLKSMEKRRSGRHGFSYEQDQFEELDALTEAIDDLDLETVDFLMGEIGKADLNVARELAKILEEPRYAGQWLCSNAEPTIGHHFSLLEEVTQGAKNSRSDGALYYLHMIGDEDRCCLPNVLPISDVQRMMGQITAATRRDKEQSFDYE